jgi:hypothetical protein
MSLMGQKRKWPRWNGMSVLPSTTDIVRPPRHVRFVPSPEVSRFIDHFVGAFLLDKASRLHEQKASAVLSSSSHNMAPIVIRSHVFDVCFWIDGREQT